MADFDKKTIKRLFNDAVFKERIASDASLNRLWSEREDEPGDIEAELLASLGNAVCRIEGSAPPRRWWQLKAPKAKAFVFEHPSPGVIALLSHLKSPFVSSDGKIRNVDVDIALHVLAMKRDALNGLSSLKTDIELTSAGLCAALRVDYLEAFKALDRIFRIAFSPFRMLPETAKVDDAPVEFDADWLARFSSIVAVKANLPISEIIWDTPLCVCGHYLIDHMRDIGVKGIGHETKSGECMARLRQLMKERVAEWAS
jgi:hypothetical protein